MQRPSRNWLEHQYITLGKTQKEIAAELGCSRSAVTKWCQHYSIPTRPASPRPGTMCGPNNPNWKDRRNISGGRVHLRLPNHPRANTKEYIHRSWKVWEENTGHMVLPGEIVHHKDEDPLNDDFENLQLFRSRSEHQKYHHSRRKQGC